MFAMVRCSYSNSLETLKIRTKAAADVWVEHGNLSGFLSGQKTIENLKTIIDNSH